VGLLDDIREAQWQPKKICRFGEYIASLPDKDRTELLEAVADNQIASQAILVACRKHGFTGGDSIIRRHRRQECICH
jgi:hypothetical protein